MKSNRVILEIRSPPDVLVCFLPFIILWRLCTETQDCTGTKLKFFSDLLWTFTWMCIMFSHNPCLCYISFNILIFSYVSLKQGKEKWSGVEMEYTFQDPWKSFRSLAWRQDSTKTQEKEQKQFVSLLLIISKQTGYWHMWGCLQPFVAVMGKLCQKYTDRCYHNARWKGS